MPLVIAAAGLVLILVQWSHGRMLWLDEEMIAINIRDRSFAGLAGRLSLGQAAPYGWLVIERMVLLAAGAGERALRVVPVLFGAATLAAAVWVGRRWMTLCGASALAFLCAFGQCISFHALELKHYSADVCFGLLLPALAVWATDARFVTGLTRDNFVANCKGPDPLQMRRRTRTWWLCAAASQWIANGALFVAPACGVVLFWTALRRFGWREALRTSAPAGLWILSFAGNYLVALGPARSSEFLQGYWLPAFPPADAGVGGTLSWLAAQLAPIAVKPGGSGFPFAFWIVAALGFAIGRVRGGDSTFRLTFALVPLSAFLWTAVRLVPMSERLTLWIVPALYVGMALSADAAVRWTLAGIGRRKLLRAVAGVVTAAAVTILFLDILHNGMTYIALRAPDANHELDDRGAVGWLSRQARDGDVWIATWNSLPAIWWYAAPQPDRMLESGFEETLSPCGGREIGAALAAGGYQRALVYFGFGHNIPPEYDDAMMRRLSGIGLVTGYRRFGRLGHAVVVDLHSSPSRQAATLSELAGDPALQGPHRRIGCVTVKPARPW